MRAESMLALCIALALGLAGGARADADGTGIVHTKTEGAAVPYLGSEHRSVLNEIAERPMTPAQARELLKPVIAWCDGKVSDDETTYVSVKNDQEAKEFSDTRPHAKRVVLIDVACPMAYKQMAYQSVEDHDLDGALPWLDKAQAIGPFFVEARIERGFVLNQLHRMAEAMDSYQQALAVLERYPDDPSKGIALRGMGYALVEMGDLKGARKAYEDSLVVAPDSDVAKRELEYIDAQEKPH